MQRFILAFWLLTLFFTDAYSQPDKERNIYHADARAQLHALKTFTSVYVDSSANLEIGDIIKMQGIFSPLNSFGTLARPGRAYWLKLTIQPEGTIKNWWLILNNDSTKEFKAESEKVDVWTLDSNDRVLEHQRTGLMVPRSEKSIKEKPGLNRVYFSAANGETKNLFLRVYNNFDSTEITAPELRDSQVGFPGTSVDLGIIFQVGGVMMLCIFSLFLYLFVRDKSYLFFALYTFTLSQHYLFFLDDYPLIRWYVPEHPDLAIPLFYSLAVGGLLLFIWFGRYFVNLSKISPRLDKFLKVGTVIVLVWLFANIYTLTVFKRQILIPFMFIFIVGILAFLVRLAFFKTNLIRIYVAGALWLFIFTLLGLLRNEGLIHLPFNPWPIGQIGQIIIYTLGIAYKIRENEKEKAQAELVRIRNVELAGLYEESSKQKKEIEIQKKNAEDALEELKTTQSQLIQSEKMASLGELTAGIAHEIQNPLNFVNNFSELNHELIEELQHKLETSNIPDALKLSDDIKENEQKILLHGKRADSIVKSMLQHSRATGNKRERININDLIDEYVKLAYHGMRAKDKNFNVKLEIALSNDVGFFEGIPQDFGRVILNLINNAFYAVNEKKRINADSYEPVVMVSTQLVNHTIQIRISDNGTGIPANVTQKIFQPFFTTKPTGQGTGLGLSLSYDIIKSYDGDIRVSSKEGEGTEFLIVLNKVQ